MLRLLNDYGHGKSHRRALLSSTAFLCAFLVGAPLALANSGDNKGFVIRVDGVAVAGDVAQKPVIAPASLDKQTATKAKPKPRAPKSNLPLPKAKPTQADDGVDETITASTPSADGDHGRSTPEIDIQYLGKDVEPQLTAKHTAVDNGFRVAVSTNIAPWIERAELIIFDPGRHDGPNAPLGVIAVPANGEVTFGQPRNAQPLAYVVRAYGVEGGYNETVPALLTANSDTKIHYRSGAGRRIAVHGGAVSLAASGLQPNEKIQILGQSVQADGAGSVKLERILPPGAHELEVAVGTGDGDTQIFSQSVEIPDSEWTYVALADLTIGHKLGDAPVEQANDEEFERTFFKGRAAFYLKGKIKGKYVLTAAMDSGEDELDQMFRGMVGKDPNALLKRIDPETYYPVYGDGSTSFNDAPTSGKFYVRLERADSHVMWGDFNSRIDNTHLLRSSRSLYGARAVIKSEQEVAPDKARLSVQAHAALPDTLPKRDLFESTGGSVYFLAQQDIVPGSETIEVIVSRRSTRVVLERLTLTEGEDYEIRPIQGIVLLSKPLSLTNIDSPVVREGGLGDLQLHLSVDYEYQPIGEAVDGYVYGGRAETWLNERVRIGATGHNETTGAADQTMAGADVRVELSENSHVEAEYAQSKGPGFGTTTSTDGGLTINQVLTQGRAGQKGYAFQLRGSIDASDMVDDLNAVVSFDYSEKTAGFSTYTDDIEVDERAWRVAVNYALSEKLSVRGEHRDFSTAAGERRTDTIAEVRGKISDKLSVEVGVTRSDIINPESSEDGERIDGGARVSYAFSEQMKAWVFGQGTLRTTGVIDRNDRFGIGGFYAFNEKLSAEAEVSEGTSGVAFDGRVDFKQSEDRSYYTGYRLDPSVSDIAGAMKADDGKLVVGARHKINDVLAATTERAMDFAGEGQAVTSSYGLEWTPDDRWTLAGSLERGVVDDPDDVNFDRNAYALMAKYVDDDLITASIRGEIRNERSEDGTRNADTYLLLGGVKIAMSDDWTLKADGKAVWSTSDQQSFLDGRFVDTGIGFAYRPTEHDRFNVLFHHRFVYDLPGGNQVNNDGQIAGPAQKSYIVSVDGGYQVNQYLTLGGKLGYRLGEVADNAQDLQFEQSRAFLAVARADVHVLKSWDVLGEMRHFALPDADQSMNGALVGVYRHIGEHAKLGIGYNFGRFSDDLADLTHDDEGVFLNALAKF